MRWDIWCGWDKRLFGIGSGIKLGLDGTEMTLLPNLRVDDAHKHWPFLR
jgi:hypothetical protein